MVGLTARRLVAALLGLGLVLGLGSVLLLSTGLETASAAAPALPGVDCKHPPEPASPDSGAASAIDPGPDYLVDGDPFARGATVSIYDVYGYAGLETVSYDPGCTNIGDGTNNFANFVTSCNQLGIALTVRLARIVFNPSTMAMLAPIQHAATDAFGTQVFLPLIGVAGGLTGLWILCRAHRGRVKENASAAGWAVLVTALALAAIIYPITLGATADGAMTGAIGGVNAAVTGTPHRNLADSVAGNLHHALLYQAWASENFGRADNRTAAVFGPRLFRAAAFTRAEQAQINKHPDAAEKLIERKQDDYKKAAEELKQADPQAYAHLAGHHNGARVGVGFLALLGMLCAVAYLAMAMARLLYAMVMVRLGIAGVPLIAVLAQHPRLQWVLLGTLNTMGGAVVAAVVYGIIAVVYVAACLGTLLSPTSTIDPVVSYVVLAAITAVLWRLTRRVGRITPPQLRARWGARSRAEAAAAGAASAGAVAVGAADDSRSSGPTLDDTYGPPSAEGYDGYSQVIPVEARQRLATVRTVTPTVVQRSLQGAVQAAAATAAVGMVPGGAVSVAGAATGAARSAMTTAPQALPTQATRLTEPCLTEPRLTEPRDPGPVYQPGRHVADLPLTTPTKVDDDEVYVIYAPTPGEPSVERVPV